MEKRFKVSKWIMLPLAILVNAFLIYESCLEGESSSLHSEWLTNLVVSAINHTKPSPEVSNVPLESISLVKQDNLISSDNVVLGTTSTYEVVFTPNDASNKNVKFVSTSESINPVQSNNIVRVEGLNLENNITLSAISLENESITSSIAINVIDRPVPSDFSISINNQSSYELMNGYSVPIDVNVNGYDSQSKARLFTNPDLISYSSSNPSVAVVENGTIKSVGVGSTIISAPNSKNSISLSVTNNPDIIHNVITSDDWTINGSNIAHTHDYDYIDDSEHNFFTQLSVNWGSNNLTDQSVVWRSSDETIARVDKTGKVYGHKKSGNVTITAISNADSSKSKSFPLIVQDVLPTAMNINFTLEDPMQQGDSMSFEAKFEPINTTNKNIEVVSLNPDILEATSSGWNVNVRALNVGVASIKVSSKANPELNQSQSFEIIPIQPVSNEEASEIGFFLRKSAGHFLAFGVSGVLILITLYMFLYEKFKKWILLIMSIATGVIIAGITEIIQIFVPGRSGTIVDVLIDMAGFVLFTGILIGIYYLVLYIKKRKH